MVSRGASTARGKAKDPFAPASLVTTLQRYAQHGYLDQQSDPSSLSSLGFCFGIYHGGVLCPQTRQRRREVTTFARLDHHEVRRGYRAGREYYFVDADPPESRMSERLLLQRLCESVTEMVQWHDDEDTWCFFVGCLLGELSGYLFPRTQAEHQASLAHRQRGAHTIAQEPR